MINLTSKTILEKAAVDNGFGLGQGASGNWLIFKAHAASASLCLTVTDIGFGIGTDHDGAAQELASKLVSLPDAPHGFHAWKLDDSEMLGSIARKVWRLARSLPDEPLQEFKRLLADPPVATEAEGLRRERIGQDVFRRALMLLWDDACAVTSIRHPRLLRASHIIPWSECDNDAERLNVHNGLLLAAHLDAAFDAHLISFDEDGQIYFSSDLTGTDAAALGLNRGMRLRWTDPEMEKRLIIHRQKTLRKATGK